MRQFSWSLPCIAKSVRVEYMQIHIQEKSFQIREKRNVLYYMERMVKPIRRWLERGSVIATGSRQNNGTLERHPCSNLHTLQIWPVTWQSRFCRCNGDCGPKNGDITLDLEESAVYSHEPVKAVDFAQMIWEKQGRKESQHVFNFMWKQHGAGAYPEQGPKRPLGPKGSPRLTACKEMVTLVLKLQGTTFCQSSQ